MSSVIVMVLWSRVSSKNACVTAETASPAASPPQDIWSGRTAQTNASITAITKWYWAT
ncbi:hypothetical protein [Streptomyces hygroscopicus]|uniref:hypothetical protein n=1 Tax=Streptomyces hygroscopicus TaxID=1912 RepID=UPI001FCB15CC|nr:hypothetical protein [Streptomyces hygroscopicus]